MYEFWPQEDDKMIQYAHDRYSNKNATPLLPCIRTAEPKLTRAKCLSIIHQGDISDVDLFHLLYNKSSDFSRRTCSIAATMLERRPVLVEAPLERDRTHLPPRRRLTTEIARMDTKMIGLCAREKPGQPSCTRCGTPCTT